jgi:hypothetical protein
MKFQDSLRWIVISILLLLLLILAFKLGQTPAVIGQAFTDPPDASPDLDAHLEAVPGGPGFYTQSAAAFRPRSSSTEYQLTGPRLRTTSAPTTYDAPLDLPNGTQISRLVIYFTDNDDDPGVDFSAEIWRVPLPGRTGERVSETISSTGAPGEAFVETINILEPEVDLAEYAYYIRLSLPASINLEVNGLRVDYTYEVEMPLIRASE